MILLLIACARCRKHLTLRLIGHGSCAGGLPTQHEVVRISPLGSHMPLRILGTDLPSPVRSPPAQDLFSGPKGAAEVDVNLDYMAGCQRGHSSRLTIPVSPPFR